MVASPPKPSSSSEAAASALESLEELLAAAETPEAGGDFPNLLSRMLQALLPIV